MRDYITHSIASMVAILVYIGLSEGGDSSYYSLIVTDNQQMQWVVDYNLTAADCIGMTTSSAECRLQEGKLP